MNLKNFAVLHLKNFLVTNNFMSDFYDIRVFLMTYNLSKHVTIIMIDSWRA